MGESVNDMANTIAHGITTKDTVHVNNMLRRVDISKDPGRLRSFLNSMPYPTEENPRDYYVFDQITGEKRCMSNQQKGFFYELLYDEYVAGRSHTWAVRQLGQLTDPLISRLIIDVDIKCLSSYHFSSKHRKVQSFVRKCLQFLPKFIAIGSEGLPPFAVFVATRKETTVEIKTDNVSYKDGIHIYLDLMLHKKARQAYLQELNKNGSMLAKLLEPSGVGMGGARSKKTPKISNPESFIDKASASFPPLLLGGVKPTADSSYEITSLFMATIMEDGDIDLDVREQEFNRADFNPVALCSPDHVPSTWDGTIVVEPSMSIRQEIDSKTIQNVDDGIDESNEFIDIQSLDSITFRETAWILKIISSNGSIDYTSWRNVMFALARHDMFKPLARRFSKLCPDKYNRGEFEAFWEEAKRSCGQYQGLNMGMLANMAKATDMQAYKDARSHFVLDEFCRSISEAINICGPRTAELGDVQLAKILKCCMMNRYVAVPALDATKRTDTGINIYTLVTRQSKEYDAGREGHYVVAESTAALSQFISKNFITIMCSIRSLFKKKINESSDEKEIASARAILSVIGKAYKKCNTHAIQQAIIRSFTFRIVNHGFSRMLDSHPYVVGGYDQVHEAGYMPKKAAFGRYMVNITTKRKLLEIDPDNVYFQRAAYVVMTMFSEEEWDAFLYNILAESRACSHVPREPIALNRYGPGRNGKSTMSQMTTNSLGLTTNGGRAYPLPIEALTHPPKGSASAREDLMQLKDSTYVVSTEPPQGAVIREDNGKAGILSGEMQSARRNYGSQESFLFKGVLIVNSNGKILLKDLNSDRAIYKLTWGWVRRWMFTHFKISFVASPTGPNERKAKPDIMKSWVHEDDFLDAWYSILMYVHSLLMLIHDGDIVNIHSPTIQKDTDLYRESFDLIGKFINNRCVYTVDQQSHTKLNEFIVIFRNWYNKENKTVEHDLNDLRSAFLTSCIANRLSIQEGSIGKSEYYVRGLRPLGDAEEPMPDEKWYKPRPTNTNIPWHKEMPPKGKKLPFEGKIPYADNPKEFLTNLRRLWRDKYDAHMKKSKSGSNFPSGAIGKRMKTEKREPVEKDDWLPSTTSFHAQPTPAPVYESKEASAIESKEEIVIPENMDHIATKTIKALPEILPPSKKDKPKSTATTGAGAAKAEEKEAPDAEIVDDLFGL